MNRTLAGSRIRWPSRAPGRGARRIGGATIALSLGLTGCAGNGFEPPADEPTIDGFVTLISAPSGPAGDTRLVVQVDEVPEDSSGSPKFSLTIDDETQLLRWNDDAGVYGTFDPVDLATGQHVRAWVTGPIMESYPMQATAHTIVLLE